MGCDLMLNQLRSNSLTGNYINQGHMIHTDQFFAEQVCERIDTVYYHEWCSKDSRLQGDGA